MCNTRMQSGSDKPIREPYESEGPYRLRVDKWRISRGMSPIWNKHLIEESEMEAEKEIPNGKAFYVVTALRSGSAEMAALKRFAKEKEAVEHAQNIIQMRQRDGSRAMDFFILKVVSTVAPQVAPVKVTKLK